MSAIDLLHAAHPFPPPDVAVGFAPISYLNRPTAAAAGVTATVAGGPFGAPLTRVALRAICLNRTVAPLEKYACIMAWGGQRFGNFDVSIGSRTLARLIQDLLASANNRQIDFLATQAAAALIPGLGISFYTKLLFFLRPVQDVYIFDQWTAKSLLLLQFPPVIRLGPLGNAGFARAHPATTPAEYERFCQTVDDLRTVLWPGFPAATAEQVEMAMFDRSRPDGFWRAFVRINFKHPVAGKLLVNGGESLTQAHDYRCGLLVIRRIDPPRLFVIGIHGSCCHWSSDDCYRLLLARLRELLAQHKLPITLVLPPGPCPQWFTDAFKDLGITVECSSWSDESASAGVDTDDDDKELLDPIGMIRPASPQDEEFITNLAHAFDRFGPYVPFFVNMLNGNRAALQDQGVIGEVELFIHEDDAGERTSFVAVEWKNGGIGDIRGVAVDERHRRKGVANHLLDHVKKLAHQRGTLKLECITAETANAPALSCFTDWGFENLGFVGNYPKGQRAVKLRATLPPL